MSGILKYTNNKSKSKKLFISILPLMMSIYILGVAYYGFNVGTNTPNNIVPTDIVTPTPTLISTQVITPSPEKTTIPTSAPTSSSAAEKNIKLTLSSASGVANTIIELKIPINSEVQDFNSQLFNQPHFNASFPKYQIVGNNSEYVLAVGQGYESFPSNYKDLIDLKTTEYFGNLYRVKSVSSSSISGYTTSLFSNKDCANSGIATPCGNPGIFVKNELYLDVNCKSSTETGLKACDEIVKSIRKSK